MRHTDGPFRARLWDEETSTLLAASGESAFIKTIGIETGIGEREPRTFLAPTSDGNLETKQISLRSYDQQPMFVGKQEASGLEWTDRRIYQRDVDRASTEGRLVAFGPQIDRPDAEHGRALSKIRDLINAYGREAAWLWDPYLSADDLLLTLFHCSTSGAQLRGLTAGRSFQDGVEDEARTFDWVARQKDRLETAKGNLRGLKLEFRIRRGSKGWPFHDRFLIFPRKRDGALAWSLGTSINSVGRQHHILQQVSDGQMIADAFQELWTALDEPDYLIWKAP